jgi:NAD(P)-dependent dehydrogenase (short-subunit alcohol dehydrogenase family)
MNEKKVVLISGCSSGIGRALALEFHTRGCRVFATARKKVDLAELNGLGLDTVVLDVTDSSSVYTCIDRVLEKAGRIDILVNNAGYGLMGPVTEIPTEDLRLQFETNVLGLAAMIRKAAPDMIERGSGLIVNMSSVSGITATPFAGPYCASKAAVNLLSDSLRMELAPFGVKVITVQPGAIQSKFGDTAGRDMDRFRKSVYQPIFDYIKGRARTSQEKPTPVSEFAAELVTILLKKNPPPVIRIGNESFLLPLLKKLPVKMLDRILSKKFGLTRLENDLSKKK